MDNKLKAIFLSAYFTACAIISVWLIVQWSLSSSYDFRWIKVALLLATMPQVLFLVFKYLFPRYLRSSILQTLIAAGIFLSGVLACFGLVRGGEERLVFEFILVLIFILAYFAYIFWASKYSDNLKRNSLLAVGNPLPNFSLNNHLDMPLFSEELLGTPSVLMFYRGDWCPFCRAQIEDLVQQYHLLKDKNVKILLISSQPKKQSEKLSERFAVPFVFLVDKNNALANEWGISANNSLPFGLQILGYQRNLPVPTVIVTNKDNEIIFLDITGNYRIRPDNVELLNLIL